METRAKRIEEAARGCGNRPCVLHVGPYVGQYTNGACHCRERIAAALALPPDALEHAGRAAEAWDLVEAVERLDCPIADVMSEKDVLGLIRGLAVALRETEEAKICWHAELAHVAKLLGYPRAESEDFGEVDLVELYETARRRFREVPVVRRVVNPERAAWQQETSRDVTLALMRILVRRLGGETEVTAAELDSDSLSEAHADLVIDEVPPSHAFSSQVVATLRIVGRVS